MPQFYNYGNDGYYLPPAGNLPYNPAYQGTGCYPYPNQPYPQDCFSPQSPYERPNRGFRGLGNSITSFFSNLLGNNPISWFLGGGFTNLLRGAFNKNQQNNGWDSYYPQQQYYSQQQYYPQQQGGWWNNAPVIGPICRFCGSYL